MKNLFFVLLFTICFFGSNAQCIKLLDFADTTNGESPRGDLISDGNYLYGMTYMGGAHEDGVIFKIHNNGTGFTKLFDFFVDSNGYYPSGSLVYDGTFFYGMTKGSTTIFKIMPDGTNFSTVLTLIAANGWDPRGSLYYDGTYLYGMYRQGGTNPSCGTIIRVKPDGTDFMKLLNFAGSTNGCQPHGNLISDGIFLYGMTLFGGINDWGTIFKIMPDGTNYMKLLDFGGCNNGRWPFGSLISDSSYLYGMTFQGGLYDNGVIFKIHHDGTGYAKLLDFEGPTNGKFPRGSLISDSNCLYGMTSQGGIYDNGVFFRINKDGSGYTKLLDFDGVSCGSSPSGSLFYNGIAYYGMTSSGGTNNLGVIFKYDLVTGYSEIKNDPEIKIYLNPATDNLEIENSQKAEIEIINLKGQIIKQPITGTNHVKVNLSDLSRGVYIIKVKTDKEIVIKKFIKQ